MSHVEQVPPSPELLHIARSHGVAGECVALDEELIASQTHWVGWPALHSGELLLGLQEDDRVETHLVFNRGTEEDRSKSLFVRAVHSETEGTLEGRFTVPLEWVNKKIDNQRRSRVTQIMVKKLTATWKP